MEKIKWGILGLGKIAHSFVQDLLLLPDSELYAVASRSAEKAKDFGNQYEALNCYGSYEEMLADEKVDIVYIASPHSHHYKHTLMCLEAGKHVLCEKAFSINAEQARIMCAKAKEKKLFLMEAMWSRFNPTINGALEAAKKGEIGNPLAVRADFCFHFPYDTSDRLVAKELAGGALLDIGIYPIVLSYFLFGLPVRMNVESEYFPNGVDKNLIMLFDYANGEEAILNASLQYYSPCDAYIMGDKGCIKIHGRWHESNSFTQYTKSADNPKTHDFKLIGKGYAYEIQECHDCIRAGKLQSNKWSWDNTIDLMSIMDEVRSNIKLHYGEIENI